MIGRTVGGDDALVRGKGSGVATMGAPLNALLKLSRAVDTANAAIGKRLSWLILAAVLISAINAVIRKVFGVSSNAWLELQWLLFSVVFLMCSPWTLLDNEHIRIDILNNMFPKWLRNAIELLGHTLFLLPFTALMIVTAWPFFWRSFSIREQSMNAGGLPQWPAKSLIFIAFALLFLQGLSELIKRIAVVRGLIPDPHGGGGGHLSSAEAEAERLLAGVKPDADSR